MQEFGVRGGKVKGEWRTSSLGLRVGARENFSMEIGSKPETNVKELGPPARPLIFFSKRIFLSP